MTEGNRRSRELIEAARRAYVPGPTAKARVRRNLDLKIAAVAAGASGTLFGVTVAKALTFAAVASVAVGGGVLVAKRARHADPPAHVATHATHKPVVAPPVVEAAPPATPPLERELSLLFEAQQAMGAGAPARALAALDRHAAEFPQGAMTEERTAARALALCAVGRVAEARAAAKQFAARWPASPLVGRMKDVCASAHADRPRPVR